MIPATLRKSIFYFHKNIFAIRIHSGGSVRLSHKLLAEFWDSLWDIRIWIQFGDFDSWRKTDTELLDTNLNEIIRKEFDKR